jgi:uncharacterized protein
MNVEEKNRLLSKGSIDRDDLWPKIKDYENKRFQFRWEFGLEQLPTKPGVIIIRGARQSGKSTWLELKLLETIEEFGKGSGYFLNGDHIYSHDEFEQNLLQLEIAFHKTAKVKRIFIDEITRIKDWERVIKRLIDSGHLLDVLIITTGSNASDLRRSSERLPGRKGQLDKNEYIFLPISYKEYLYQVKNEIGTFESDTLWGYILTGGSPLAIHELYYGDKISETFTSLLSDWILGEFAESGRSRIFLFNLLRKLYETAPAPISYTKLAKEAGFANNTMALDYIEKLADLLCIKPLMQWDADRNVVIARKPSKFQFINLAAAWTFHPKRPRYIHELRNFEGKEKGAMYEWIVAQELWRREQLEMQTKARDPSKQLYETELKYWSSKQHEIDFVTVDQNMIEVKAGECSPLDFTWFEKVFPNHHLTVISESSFETKYITAKTLEQWLLEAQSSLYFDSDR